MKNVNHLWTIVLAAGEGSRLQSVSMDETGRPVPKQFWKIAGETTMLQWALERAERWSGRFRTVPVVAASHRNWWERDLPGVPAWNIVVQPDNRGTAAGILLPVLDVVARDRDATVVVLPSDHHVEDERALDRGIERAVAALEEEPHRIVLLGISPEGPDPELGYILPGAGGAFARPVESFVEKPLLELATSLVGAGALWNSFIFVARGTALLQLFAAVERRLVERFLEILGPAGFPAAELERTYRHLPVRDFSRDVCQKRPDLLRVVAVPPCGWTDLGTPPRVHSWRETRAERLARPSGMAISAGS